MPLRVRNSSSGAWLETRQQLHSIWKTVVINKNSNCFLGTLLRAKSQKAFYKQVKGFLPRLFAGSIPKRSPVGPRWLREMTRHIGGEMRVWGRVLCCPCFFSFGLHWFWWLVFVVVVGGLCVCLEFVCLSCFLNFIYLNFPFATFHPFSLSRKYLKPHLKLNTDVGNTYLGPFLCQGLFHRRLPGGTGLAEYLWGEASDAFTAHAPAEQGRGVRALEGPPCFALKGNQ